MQVSQIAQLDTHAVIGGGKAQAFGMSDSAEFFTVLSDTLYRDKMRAVVREVICNGWDAHIAIGKTDVPVEITLDESSLSFKDFGLGIAPDMIGPVYCVYGASTKVKDDKQTGGFGLGCKAPFAYSDHFTVMSHHAGLKTLWAISRGGSETAGKPDFRPMVQVPTSDSGITVSIPVKDGDDVRKFKEIIQSVVMEGGILATLNGEPLPRNDYEGARKSGFGIMPITYGRTYREASAYLLYGTVLYPITTTDREIMTKASKLDSLIDENSRAVLVAEPNTIGVVPSREGLSFSELTTATVHRLLDKAMAEIKRHGPGLAKKMLVEELETKKFDRYGLKVPSVSRHNESFTEVISDPVEIARRSVRERLDQHLSQSDSMKVALGIFAKQHRDSRRTFRRGLIVRSRLYWRERFELEAFEHSRRLHLRLASKLGLLDRLVVMSRIHGRDTWENKPIDEFRGASPLTPRLIIAPTRKAAQQHAWKVVDKMGTGEFQKDDQVPALILTQPSEKLLEDIRTLADKLKIKTTFLEFPKRKKAQRVGPLFFSVKDLVIKSYKLAAMKETCAEPTAYIRLSGSQENLGREIIRGEEDLAELQTLFPNTAVAWTAKQEAKLKAKKVPSLSETVLAELRPLTKSREFQFATMASECLFIPEDGRYRSNVYTVRHLCMGSTRITKFFFPDRVQIGEKTVRAERLLKVLHQLDRRSYASEGIYNNFRREIRKAARETFRHLIITNRAEAEKAFSWIAPLANSSFQSEHEEDLLEILRALKRRHERSLTKQSESTLKEAA